MRKSDNASKPKNRASPGRPRNFNREDVLDRALEMFWRHGYSNTTTRVLENELQLNQSSIYNSFGSKEKFYNNVLDRYETLTDAALLQPLQQHSAGIAELRRYFSSFSEWINRDGHRGCLLINTIAEGGDQTEIFGPRLIRSQQRLKTCFQRVLDNARHRDEISEGDNAARAMILIGLMLGLSTAARISASRAELDCLTDAILGQVNCWSKE